MLRFVVYLTFAVSFASAGTISTSATCDGVTTFGTNFASCNDGLVMADAHVGASINPPGFSVFVEANPQFFASGGASAHFSEDYLFTVTGGTGSGFFAPCFYGAEFFGGITTVSMGFGGVVFGPAGTATNCTGPGPFPFQKPFSFGVPQIVNVSIDGSVAVSHLTEGAAQESLTEIRFFDPAGNQLSNVSYTLATLPTPEPSALSLAICGLALWLMFRLTVVNLLLNTSKIRTWIDVPSSAQRASL
jgi:hypothetical protein